MIKQILTVIIGSILILVILNLLDFAGWNSVQAALIAGLINAVNAFAAYIFFEKSYQKSNNKFLIYNLGGMILRLLFLLVFVFIVIKFLKIDKYAFIFLFFIFYFTSLFFEVRYFMKKAKEQGKSK